MCEIAQFWTHTASRLRLHPRGKRPESQKFATGHLQPRPDWDPWVRELLHIAYLRQVGDGILDRVQCLLDSIEGSSSDGTDQVIGDYVDDA